jgi:AraC-like DNA-binding protein
LLGFKLKIHPKGKSTEEYFGATSALSINILIMQLMDNRNNYIQLEDKSGAPRSLEISQVVYVSLDDLFVLKARTVVEKHMADTEFNVCKFAKLMVISESTLYRRLNALYNLSPNEYIQHIRLKHAERMLKQKVGNVAAIAIAVGFNNPKYFTKCFKKCWGVTPSEILKMHLNREL